ncbi:kinetoplast-associated protein kap [Fusarium oxysporum f. sp. phaseoli]
MSTHNNYYNQGATPGPSTRFPQRLRPADDPEIMQLKAELEAYRVIEEKSKAAEERRKKEEEIRKDTEAAFQLRWEALQKAQEDTKLEMERIKKEAEAAAWERVEKEKREQETMKIREQHQARVMESEIRTKIEVERKAEEQERKSREKLESEIEMRLKKKMMDKVDDLMRVVEQRLLTYPTVWTHQTGALGTESQKEGSYGQPETQLTSGYELPQTWQPSLNGYHTRNAACCTPTPSASPRTGYPPSNADLRHGGRPPSVPDAPDQFRYAEELSPQDSRFYRHNQPHFYPRPSSPSRGRTRNRSHGYNTAQSYQEEETRARMPTHTEFVQELAYAVNDILREQIFNEMIMCRDMDDRQRNRYSSSVRQGPVDPRVYSYAADRAAAIEAQRQRQGEREYQNELPRQFGPPQGMMNGQGHVFERPFPSPSIMPRNRHSSTGGTVNADRASESSKTQLSTYQTPPQSHGGAMLVNGKRPGTSTTASTLNIPGGKNGEFDQKLLPALEDERSKTFVNQSLEALPRDSKLEKQLSAASAYMGLKEA